MNDWSLQIQHQRAIDSYTDALVDLADKTLSEARMRDLKRSMRTAQLSNLLSVALESAGPRTVEAWVMYQMGRRETSRAWRQSGFGDDVLRDLGIIRKKYLSDVLQLAYTDGNPSREAQQKAHIAMVRLYVGYLKRWFVARGGQG